MSAWLEILVGICAALYIADWFAELVQVIWKELR